MNNKQKKKRKRILVALALFVACEVLEVAGVFDRAPAGLWLEFAAFLVPFLVAGYDVLGKAWHGLTHKQPFDENLLMSIATIGAFLLVLFPESEPHMAEGAAVMLFYQVGELFESYALGKTRRSIADMMNIVPERANLLQEGQVVEVDPACIDVGAYIVINPGDRVPLDGVVASGKSKLDTSALTGEAELRQVEVGSRVASGCINMAEAFTLRVTSPYETSTAQRIMELVENATEKKARTEKFITRFARYYTPIVVGLALAIALLGPLVLGQTATASVQSALVFLVISCPCALVISIPLSFFGGIGAASRFGILVKGSNYLEALAKVKTVAFDKTGTLTVGASASVADSLKPDAKEALAALRKVGVEHIVMLTGDREEISAAVAKDLGITDYYAQCLPRDKVSHIEALIEQEQGSGTVAFVGDGINDAPVLMRADVGIAMGALGTDAAIEAADIVLMDDKPSRIARAIQIARKTHAIVWQNIVLAIGIKLCIMVLALPFIGIATMWMAVFGDVGVAILAILNAMRMLFAGRAYVDGRD